jgi:hypothetical protein
MCDEVADNVGDLVPDETVIYRACLRRTNLSPDKTQVRESAFQKAGKLERNKDGLSFRTTAAACNDLDHYGIFRIKAQDVRAIQRGVELHFDATDPSHVLMRNLPCMDRLEEQQDAEVVAAELSFRAEVESSTQFKKPKP